MKNKLTELEKYEIKEAKLWEQHDRLETKLNRIYGRYTGHELQKAEQLGYILDKIETLRNNMIKKGYKIYPDYLK